MSEKGYGHLLNDVLVWCACIFQLLYVAAPCVDNHFLIESPLVSLEKEDFKKCPLIDGFNKDEGTLLIITSEFGFSYYNTSEAPVVPKDTFDKELDFLLTFYDDYYKNDVIMDSVRQQYVDWSIVDDPEADYFDSWNYYGGDAMFVCPALMEMKSHTLASDGFDIYQYFYTHVPSLSIFQIENYGPGWLGAGHAEDLAFVFGYPFVSPELLKFHEYPDEERSISQYVMKYWTNFAKTG